MLDSILTLAPPQQQKLLALATDGEWTTPSCPSCGIKMVSREAKGRSFWGCRNFPRCNQTFAMKRDA